MQLWMEMYEAPSEGEAELVEEVLKSWFMVGRLGGFNGMNLQVGLPPTCHRFAAAACTGSMLLHATRRECGCSCHSFGRS
jgi:hypothetical protein